LGRGCASRVSGWGKAAQAGHLKNNGTVKPLMAARRRERPDCIRWLGRASPPSSGRGSACLPRQLRVGGASHSSWLKRWAGRAVAFHCLGGWGASGGACSIGWLSRGVFKGSCVGGGPGRGERLSGTCMGAGWGWQAPLSLQLWHRVPRAGQKRAPQVQLGGRALGGVMAAGQGGAPAQLSSVRAGGGDGSWARGR